MIDIGDDEDEMAPQTGSRSTTDLDPETAELLLEQAREDPESVIRSYPDHARELASDARDDGLDRIADYIEGVLDAGQRGSP